MSLSKELYSFEVSTPLFHAIHLETSKKTFELLHKEDFYNSECGKDKELTAKTVKDKDFYAVSSKIKYTCR